MFRCSSLSVSIAGSPRRGVDTATIRRVLREAKGFGLETLDHIIRNRPKFDYSFRKDYLGWNIHFRLGTDEKRGIVRFAELLTKHGLGPVHNLHYVT